MSLLAWLVSTATANRCTAVRFPRAVPSLQDFVYNYKAFDWIIFLQIYVIKLLIGYTKEQIFISANQIPF